MVGGGVGEQWGGGRVVLRLSDWHERLLPAFARSREMKRRWFVCLSKLITLRGVDDWVFVR